MPTKPTANKKTTAPKTPKAKKDMGSSSIKVTQVRNLNNLYHGEFSALKPENLHYYFEAERGGLPFFANELYSEIVSKDLRMGAVVQSRCTGVANKEFNWYYSNETSVPEPLQKERLKFLKDIASQIYVPKFISRATQAQIVGIKGFEAIYKPEGKYLYYDCIDPVKNSVLMFDERACKYLFMDTARVDGNTIRTLSWNSITGHRIPVENLAIPDISDDKIFFVEAFAGDSKNAFLNGCKKSLIWAFYFKSYGLKDWSIYNERYADPAVVGKRPRLMTREDKASFESAIKNFGKQFRITIPNEADVEMLSDSTKGSTTDLFERYVDYWDKQITIAVTGQSLTTDIGKVGSKAAADTHYRVSSDREVCDMLSAKGLMNDVTKRIFRLNGFNDAEIPEFVFEEEEDIEYKLKRSEVFSNLYQAGWKVKQDDIETEFDVEVEPTGNNGDFPSGPEEYIRKFIKESI